MICWNLFSEHDIVYFDYIQTMILLLVFLCVLYLGETE